MLILQFNNKIILNYNSLKIFQYLFQKKFFQLRISRYLCTDTYAMDTASCAFWDQKAFLPTKLG